MDGLLDLGILLGLTLLNGFFSAAELAVLSVRRSRLEELAAGGSSSAAAVLALRADPERFLATVQVGITVVGATAGAFGGSVMAEPLEALLTRLGAGPWAGRLSLVAVVALVSFLSIVLGELVPKSLALRSSEPLALLVAHVLRLLSRLASPLVWLLTAASNLVLRPFRDSTTFVEGRLSPDELRQLVEEAADAGTLDVDAGEIAARAIDFSTLRLRAVMIPRPGIAALRTDATVADVRALLRARPHARYPVLGPREDDVAGYVVARDVFHQLLDGTFDLRALLRPCTFLPEPMLAVDALRALQAARSGIGVVVDETGAVAGLVSVEDLAEELVGDIVAEHETPVELVETEGPGVHLVDGATPVHELNRALGLELPLHPGVATLAGSILHESGSIPSVGERVTLAEGIEAEIVEASPQRIRRVRLRVPLRASEPPPE